MATVAFSRGKHLWFATSFLILCLAAFTAPAGAARDASGVMSSATSRGIIVAYSSQKSASGGSSRADANRPNNFELQNLELQRRLADANDRTSLFTSGLLVVGAAQVAILFLQLYLLRSTLNATKTAAEAAKKSADLSEQAMHTTERAYLDVDSVAIENFGSGQTPRISVTTTNRGRTPATLVSSVITFDVAESLPAVRYGEEVPRFRNVGPGATFEHVMLFETPLSDAEHALVVGEDRSIFVWGRMRYLDAFGKEHVVGFGAVARGAGRGVPALGRTSVLQQPGYNYST